MRLLPGGPGIQGGMSKAVKGYVSLGYYGMPAGRNAFRFVVGHELVHVTSQNERVKVETFKESNASHVAERIFGAFK